MLTNLEHINIIAVEPGLLHSNLNFARQFGCFTRQFSIANDNLTMKKPKTGKTTMTSFLDWNQRLPNCI